MKKEFGAYIRQCREEKWLTDKRGYSLRAVAKKIGVTSTYLSNIETGKVSSPSEALIIKLAEALCQNQDLLFGLAGKVSQDVLDKILLNPIVMAEVIRNFKDVPTNSQYNTKSPIKSHLEFYPLEKICHENHTAVIGESGSGKSLLTKYLVYSYFNNDAEVYDSDAAPHDWNVFKVTGRKGDYAAILQAMYEDIDELQRRTELYGEGLDVGEDLVRIIEEYPSTAAELAEISPKIDTGRLWLRKILRRGRKYRIIYYYLLYYIRKY